MTLVPFRPRTGEEVNSEACPLDSMVVVADKCVYMDQQTLSLQELPESVPTSEMPRSVQLSVDRYLCNSFVPGSRVVVSGVFSVVQQSSRGGGAVRQPYLRVVGMRAAAAGGRNARGEFTDEEQAEFKRIASRPDLYDVISRSIAPSIMGRVDIKKAIALQLFGGARKSLPDGMRVRGDINVLLLGDPSTAKSQLLKFVEKVAPVAVYTSGKGSSAAGLTASVIRDANTNEFYLEGGAMVLADGGIVCIDEFDKMRVEDRCSPLCLFVLHL